MVKGKLLVNLDKGILPAGTEMMLLPAVEQGFLVQNGDKYNSELTLAGDSVTLNGKPVPLDGLAQLVAPGAGMSTGAAGMGAGGADPADMGIPDDLMQKIQQEGLTPEVMQLLEESDDVPRETVDMMKQLQQMQSDVKAGNLPAGTPDPSGATQK